MFLDQNELILVWISYKKDGKDEKNIDFKKDENHSMKSAKFGHC